MVKVVNCSTYYVHGILNYTMYVPIIRINNYATACSDMKLKDAYDDHKSTGGKIKILSGRGAVPFLTSVMLWGNPSSKMYFRTSLTRSSTFW